MNRLHIILLFFSYSSFHMLRMTYSFNKSFVKQDLRITNFYLGVLDALVYVSLGIGVLFRYKFIRSAIQKTRTYLITSVFANISIALVAFVGFMYDYENIDDHPHYFLYKIVITAALIVFGFSQLTSQPIVQSLLNNQIGENHNSKLQSLAQNSSIGNIAGLIICNFLVFNLYFKWQVSLLVSGIVCLSMSLLVYFFINNTKSLNFTRTQVHNNQIQQQKLTKKQGNPTNQQFFNFSKKILTSHQYKYYLATYALLKTMIYTYLLWYPVFLDGLKIKKYAGYITMLFQLASIFGGFLLAKIEPSQRENYFSNVSQEQIDQYRINQNSFYIQKLVQLRSLISMGFVIIFSVLFLFMKSSVLKYCIFSFGVGFFLGGTMKTMGSSNNKIFVGQNKKFINYLSTLNNGIGYISIGIVQLIVGISLYEKGQIRYEEQHKKIRLIRNQKSYKILFIILLGIAILISLLFFFRMFLKNRKKVNLSEFQQSIIAQVIHDVVQKQ